MPKFETKLILAPMAGFTDQPFRRLARALGADEVVTELVSANALVRDHPKTYTMIELAEDERPASIQIFGADPAIMADAAQRVEAMRPEFIDINMGCPVKKIVKTGAGAALLENPKLAVKIVKAVVDAVETPVSVKIRTGKNAESKTGLEIARLSADAGMRRISVHARSLADGFSGPVDYESVASLKKELQVEVIGNGGIYTHDDARRWIERTGCDGLMIGRGAVGHPSIFRAIKNGEDTLPHESEETVIKHIEWMEAFYAGRRVVGLMRGHLIRYSKGLPEARRFRNMVCQAETFGGMAEIVKEFFGKTVQHTV